MAEVPGGRDPIVDPFEKLGLSWLHMAWGRTLVDNLLGTNLSAARKQGLEELIATLDLR